MNSNNISFKGKEDLLNLYYNIVDFDDSLKSSELIKEAFKSCKTIEDRILFYRIIFSIGDINNRKHNIFKNLPIKNIDNGGSSNRYGFYHALKFILKNDEKQFYKFLQAGLFNEYQCFDTLLINRYKGNESYTFLDNEKYREELSNYIVKVFKSDNDFNKLLICKFLSLPRLSKRKNHKKMLDRTKYLMSLKIELLILISKKMNWGYVVKNNYINFYDYRKFRQKYNTELESVLFSTNTIFDFTKDQFLDWLNKAPALAKERIKRKLFHSNKNIEKKKNLQEWFLYYEEYKENKLKELLDLEDKINQNLINKSEVNKELKELKEEAKVNVGAISLKDIFKDIYNKKPIDSLKLEQYVRTINLNFNFLTFIDISGSMSGYPLDSAIFIASLLLYKNKDDNAKNLIGLFSNNCSFYNIIDEEAKSINRFVSNNRQTIKKPLINPKENFMFNYDNIKGFIKSKAYYGGTNLSSINDKMKSLYSNDTGFIDVIKKYPVWVLISDGEFNNMSRVHSCITNLLETAQTILGFKPFVICIDITKGNVNPYRINIENFLYIPNNPSLLESVIENFRDFESFNSYTVLTSLFKTNRYILVDNNILH